MSILKKIKKFWILRELYYKEFSEKGINIFSISLLLPKIKINEKLVNEFQEEHRITELEFSTKICFVKQTDGGMKYWNFTIQILGFGLFFMRQDGY